MAPEPQPEPEPQPPYVNPLTGEGCWEDVSQDRPVAVMLNNLKKALPQLGVSQADIIYEAPAEGGHHPHDGRLPVGGRGWGTSARCAPPGTTTYPWPWAMTPCSSTRAGAPAPTQPSKTGGAAAFDCVNGPYEGTLFWRDKERRRNMGMEHSVLTSGDTISELLPTYGYRMEHQEDFSYPVQFLDQDQTAQGDPGTTVSVTFSTYKTGVFHLRPGDRHVRRIRVRQPLCGRQHGPAGPGEKTSWSCAPTCPTSPGTEAGRLKVRTTGTGSGLLFCDGTVQEITWSKARDSAPMTYLTPTASRPGWGWAPSYVNIVSNSAQVTVE